MMHPESKRGLGIEAQERIHLEDLVVAEVEKRIQLLKDDAYRAGFEQGLLEGKADATAKFLAEFQPKFDQFLILLNELDQVKSEIYSANEQFLIQLIFQISSHVLLGELKTDRDYVKRLSMQIVEKLGAKDSIRLKVNRDDHANLESLRDFLKVQFPDLKNIQIDLSDELELGGVKVETDLARVNASVENQLLALETSLMGRDS